jgi:hypothetical protein
LLAHHGVGTLLSPVNQGNGLVDITHFRLWHFLETRFGIAVAQATHGLGQHTGTLTDIRKSLGTAHQRL